MKRTLIVLAVAGLLGSLAAAPRVEVVFALDSTGSMGGLIEGAKRKIWSIANTIADRSPRPELRIGLVSYRDRGDDYVTKRLDLTADIDAVFETLGSFNANGGGDGPESVNQALHEAVTLFSWSADPRTLKIVFLVGDYPPHMDYEQDVRYQRTCAEAVKKGIVINAVQCGSQPETAAVWREIAGLAKGEYVALSQSGNMAAIATPYDEAIARVSEDLGKTMLSYGSMEEQATARAKVAKAAEAPASVAADRAAYNVSSGGKAIQGRGDLVDDAMNGLADPAALKESELPPELKGLKPAERLAYVKALNEKRAALNASIADLSSKRAAYIEAENKRLASASGGDSFDEKVSSIVAEQAARLSGDK